MRYFYSLGATEEAIPEDLDYVTKRSLEHREREVKAQEYMTWIELAKFAALLMIPVGAILGIGPITKALKKAITG